MSRLRSFFWFSLTLFIVWRLLFPPSADENEISRPTTEDRRVSGLAALAEWVERSGIDVYSQRLRFTELPDAVKDSAGHLAVVHLPAVLVFEAEETQALLNWVDAGNTLVISAGFLEGSQWINDGQNVDVARSFWRLTGLGTEFKRPETAEGDSEDSADEETLGETVEQVTEEVSDSIADVFEIPGWLLLHGGREVVRLETDTVHPLVDGLNDLQVPWDEANWSLILPVEQELRLEMTRERELADKARAESIAQDSAAETQINNGVAPPHDHREHFKPRWQDDLDACGNAADASVRQLAGKDGCLTVPTPAGEDWQILLRHEDQDQIALFAAPLGAGRIVTLWQPSLLDNEVMHRFGNRYFAANLIDNYLGKDGAVVIDDAHQGLNRIYEADDLLRDPRLYISIAFLLLVWAAYLFADAGQWARALWREPRPSVGQKQLIDANANFLSKRLSVQATHELQLLPLAERLARKWRLSQSEALETGLDLEQRANPAAVDELRRSLRRLARGKNVAPLLLQGQIDALLKV